LRGDFTLRSGRKSKYYLDKYLFEAEPKILRELGERFARHIGPQTTRIAGAELGGVALGGGFPDPAQRGLLVGRNSPAGNVMQREFWIRMRGGPGSGTC
jgi:orotate phosphoribosyltransferase